MNNLAYKIAIGLLAIGLVSTTPGALPTVSDTSSPGAFLLTIFLKHDQSKTQEQINLQLREQGFYRAFPPAGIGELVRHDGYWPGRNPARCGDL